MIRAGDIIKLGKRMVRVACMPGGSLCQDARGRVAVRNILTHRLSYIPATRLLKGQKTDASERLDAAVACLQEVERWLCVLEHGPDDIDERTHGQMLQRVRTALLYVTSERSS